MCFHNWRLYEKPKYKSYKHICSKCGKIKEFKKNKDRSYNYIFCPTCGIELKLTNAYVNVKNKDDNEYYEYKCLRCGAIHYFNFDIAPVPIKCNEDGYIL